MKLGELQDQVIRILQKKGPMSVREILNIIITQTGKKDYAYTTISTTLNRLENKGIVKSKFHTYHGHKIKLFEVQDDAPKRAVDNMITQIISRFGMVGVRHLSSVFNEKLTDEELERIKNEFQID